jgi:hypothetical protein
VSASTRAALCSIQRKEHLAQALRITKSGKVTIGAKPERVADLVYFAFHPTSDVTGAHVVHVDGNVGNNRLENLRLLNKESWRELQYKQNHIKNEKRQQAAQKWWDTKRKIQAMLPLWGHVEGYPENIHKFKLEKFQV